MQIPPHILYDLRTLQGFDESGFIAAHRQPAPTSIRKHPVKGASIHFHGSPVPWCADGITIPDRPVFTLDPAFHAGAYYVQESSSMFLAHMFKELAPDGALRILDLCAAPGGKSTLLASLMSDDSLLISNEVIRTRATILEENCTKWGYTGHWVTCNDPASFSTLGGYFDVIVVDAPCSGSGLFRKDSRALEMWSDANVALCSGRQQRILADIWPALKENGMLIYATCSFSMVEDEAILDRMADEFSVESLSVAIPDEWGIINVVSQKHKMAGYRFLPGKVAGEGFFIAAIRKKDRTQSFKQPRFKPSLLGSIRDQASYLLKHQDFTYLQPDKDSYAVIHPAHEMDWNALNKLLYFRKVGLPVGSLAQREWLPSHETALSIDLADDIPAINVSRDEALRFLKREDFASSGDGRGWRMVKFNNQGLGWVKLLGNRMNNYLPKHWRIRMELPDSEDLT